MGYPIIKAACITNLTDARYFAAKSVAFLGFNLVEGTEGYLDPMYMKAMRAWVEGPHIVGEFAHTPVAVVAEAARFFELDAVQLAGLPDTQDLAVLADWPVLLQLEWPPIPAALIEICAEKAPFVQYFILEITAAHWPAHADLLQTLCAKYPFLLHIHLDTETVQTIMEQVQPAGLNLQGGEEEQVGIKSFDTLDTIFDLFEED
jgi:phosphoribosylanthranilate isomerase